MNTNGFGNILYTAVIAFFGALAKEINDKTTTDETFSRFFGQVILHGFSGWIVGLCANKYLGLTDMTSITIFAGIGGLFGYDLIKIILKMILKVIASTRNIDLKDSDINFDEDDKKNK